MLKEHSVKNRTSIAATYILLALLLGLVASASAEKNPKLAPELQNATDSKLVNVIIRYNVVPGLQHAEKVKSHQGQVTKDLSLVNDLAAVVPANQLATLAIDPDVAYIAPDRAVGGFLDSPAPAVFADVAWNQGLDGSGIAVAVIDSGIQESSAGAGTATQSSAKTTRTLSLLTVVASSGGSPDLNTWNTTKSRVVYSQSWINDNWGTLDGFGHGTHVAGLIAGNGFKSTGEQFFQTFKGMAPNVNLVNLRVLDRNGMGKDSDVIAAIQTTISLKRKYNIRVLNLSLGRPVFESYLQDPLCQAVEAAYKAGMVVVVSAGNFGRDNSYRNNGYATITSPANDPYVITVGAMRMMGTPDRSDDLIASYSSKGPTAVDHIAKPDLVAPGNRVVSLLSWGAFLNGSFPDNAIPLSAYQSGQTFGWFSTDYYVLSGTSMAAPVVSGAAALLLQQNPKMSPDQVKARLMKTASKTFPRYSSYTEPATGVTYTSQYDVFTVGAGYLDLQAALASTELSSGSAKSPAVAYDPATQSVYFVNDSFAVWGGSSNWSSFAVWGGNAFVNSDFAVWGGSSNWASFAVWGGSAPWGSDMNSGFFAVWGGSTVGSNTTTSTESMNTLMNGDK